MLPLLKRAYLGHSRGMNIREALAMLASNGLGIAQEVFERGAEGLGLDDATVRQYSAIGTTYFGPCNDKPTRRAVMEIAVDFPIARLAIIHKAAAQLSPQAAISRWELRLELARLVNLSLAELQHHAVARVRELNRASKSQAPRSLIIGRRSDATGRRTAVLKLPEAEMAGLERRIRSMISQREKTPEDIAMGNAMWNLLTRNRGGVNASAKEPTVLLCANDLESSKDGTTLLATDGTTIDASEYVTRHLTPLGWALLYDRHAQPVNLWRTQRLANDYQRQIIAVDQGECAWPGCDRLAMYGTAHHIKAWKHGGQTNLDNLIGLCGVHNALNDDDPESPPRNGRVTRNRDGEIIWLPPGGGPPVVKRGYLTSRSGRHWAQNYTA